MSSMDLWRDFDMGLGSTPKRKTSDATCSSCARGDHHRGEKSPLGCLNRVSNEPRDFICACDTCDAPRKSLQKVAYGRTARRSA